MSWPEIVFIITGVIATIIIVNKYYYVKPVILPQSQETLYTYKEYRNTIYPRLQQLIKRLERKQHRNKFERDIDQRTLDMRIREHFGTPRHIEKARMAVSRADVRINTYSEILNELKKL